MYTMQRITVNNIDVDSYTANGCHLHRDVNLMDGSWQMHKRNWLRQLVCVAGGMDWNTAKGLFNYHTNEDITDSW